MSTKIRFAYDKATQALNFFAIQNKNPLNKMKALKILYFADRFHFRRYGRLISNDTYYAMKKGLVASSSRDILELNGEYLSKEEIDYAQQFIKKAKDEYEYISEKNYDDDVFSDSEIEALKYSWEKYKEYDWATLSNLTHLYPEWKKHEKDLDDDRRVAIDVLDFLEDPENESLIDYKLTDEDKKIRKEDLEESALLDNCWRDR